jgi:hypothetical protein
MLVLGDYSRDLVVIYEGQYLQPEAFGEIGGTVVHSGVEGEFQDLVQVKKPGVRLFGDLPRGGGHDGGDARPQ